MHKMVNLLMAILPLMAYVLNSKETVEFGFYKHVSGGRYFVIGVGRNADDLSQESVVYGPVGYSSSDYEVDDEELLIKPIKDFVLEFKREEISESTSQLEADVAKLTEEPGEKSIDDFKEVVKLADYRSAGYKALNEGQFLKAEENYKKAANLGDEASHHALIDLYIELGRDSEAEFYLNSDAEKGDVYALYRLGSLYSEKENFEVAGSYFKKAADAGHASSQYLTGLRYERAGDIENALHYLMKASKQEHEDASVRIAIIYKEQNKLDEAEKILRDHAHHGDASAQYLLASILDSTGRVGEAIEFARLAAAQNYRPAKKFLAKVSGYKDEL